MNIQRFTRKTLKLKFQKGKLPTEASFAALIDSMVNIMDDGLNKSEDFGFEVAPQGESKNLLSFFKNLEEDVEPLWQFNVKGKENQEGIAFENKQKEDALFFAKNGNIGIHTNHPILPLTVEGLMGMNGRFGLFKIGEVPADGSYHNLLEGISEPDVYEIVARVKGPKGRGKMAITHATATCAYPGSWFNKVHQTNSFFGWPWNRIKLRWKSVPNPDYKPNSKENGNTPHKLLNLQMKTWSHYGLDKEENLPFNIQFHISKMWDEDYMKKLLDR